jgi:Fe-Mn family superoxide dismutase
MSHQLPSLPYDSKALEPYISEQTLSFHHGKHHQTYVTNLNQLIQDRDYASLSLEEVIQKSYKHPEDTAIFNNAAQVWNHTFYWSSLSPQGGKEPQGVLKDLIQRSFGDYEGFCSQFKQTALSQFGSGWAWLVAEGPDKLSLIKTGNADLPMVHGKVALLTCDVWEHAYYLDHQNRRADYVQSFLSHLINWSFAEANYHQAFGA